MSLSFGDRVAETDDRFSTERLTSDEQRHGFVEAAREADASEKEANFDAAVKRRAGARQPQARCLGERSDDDDQRRRTRASRPGRSSYAEGKRHIVDQEARIARLRVDGHDVKAFEEVLSTMRETVVEHCAHRATISSRIQQREAVTRGEGTTNC